MMGDDSMEIQALEFEDYWIKKLRNVKRFHFPTKYFHTTKVIPPDHTRATATVELSESDLSKLKLQFPYIEDPADLLLSLTIIFLTKLGGTTSDDSEIWFKIFDKKLEDGCADANTLSTSTFYNFPLIRDDADCSNILQETYESFKNQKSKLTYRRDIFEKHSIPTCDAHKDDTNISTETEWMYKIEFPNKEEIRIAKNGGKLSFARPGHFDNIFLEDLHKFITAITVHPGVKLSEVKGPISFQMKKLETLLHNHKPVKNVKFLNNDGRIEVNVELELATADSVAKSFTRQWQFTFDFMYAKVNEDNPYYGWTSSFTDGPIPINEMKAWNNNTVRAILETCNISSVLEVGCGSGLLLLPIARDPKCNAYVGTDISSKSIEKLKQSLAKSQTAFKHVIVKQCEATSLAEELSTPATYDTIISNSVLQYFKNASYLVEVLESLIPLCKPGGRIFLGDLLSLAHLEQLQTAIQLYKSKENSTREDLGASVRDALFFENELNIHPKFFELFAEKHQDSISGFDILYHRGIFHNEMFDFRYHAILYVKGRSAGCIPELIEWKFGQSADDLREILKDHETVLTKNILNARTHQYSHALNYVPSQSDVTPYLMSLKTHIEKLKNDGVHPEVLALIAEELGFKDVRIMPSKEDSSNRFDLFCSREKSDYMYSNGLVPESIATEKKSYSDYVTDPVAGKTRRMAQKALQQFLLTNKCTVDIAQFHLFDGAKSFADSTGN